MSLPNYKTSAMLLGGLFFYDVFWVFGTDVMVTVAKVFWFRDLKIKNSWFFVPSVFYWIIFLLVFSRCSWNMSEIIRNFLQSGSFNFFKSHRKASFFLFFLEIRCADQTGFSTEYFWRFCAKLHAWSGRHRYSRYHDRSHASTR